MRLVRTQAKTTRGYLKQAEELTLQAIKDNNYQGLYNKLFMLLGGLPSEAMKLMQDLAWYEQDYTVKMLTKYHKGRRNIITPETTWTLQEVEQQKVSVSLGKPQRAIKEVYDLFVEAKAAQLTKIVNDAVILDANEKDTEEKVKDITNGLFTTQNLTLAGLAILGIANIARADVARANGMKVLWSVDLELNNCEECLDRDGEVFDFFEVDGDIPMHAKCGCVLSPVTGDEE